MGNRGLNAAERNKKDEFYTQYADIEREMRYYEKHLKAKVLYCNCDDPFESNFFKYFVLNFNRFELKKVIATCYANPIARKQRISGIDDSADGDKRHIAYKAVVTQVSEIIIARGSERLDFDELFKLDENMLTVLNGDGDFRSKECLEILKESDVVVTNPPFSFFREYINLLIEKQKHFIIIGNINAITYKEFFPLLKENKVWLGASIRSGDRKFYVPDDYPLNAAGCGIDVEGRRFVRVKGVRWYTNLDIMQRHEKIILSKNYKREAYPKYDNFDAIEVSRVADIPRDYTAVMGVPITFLDKYNPDQFEIIGLDRYSVPKQFLVGGRLAVKGQAKYARILIRNKQPEGSSSFSAFS